jgi:predicted glycogen debranching enzyme
MNIPDSPNLVRRIDLSRADAESARELLSREWLLANGLGGYASGTISGAVARRYHGLLIAALPAPLGRVVVLNHIAEFIRQKDEHAIQIGGEEPSTTDAGACLHQRITEFRLENLIPVWRFEVDGIVIEKRVLLIQGQNTVHIGYKLLSPDQSIRLEIRPSVHFRRHEHNVDEAMHGDYSLTIAGNHYEIAAPVDYPALRLLIHGESGVFTHEALEREIAYQTEADRGYPSRGRLWSPGFFGVTLTQARMATLVASTEPWKIVHALSPDDAVRADEERRRSLIATAPPAAREGAGAELVLAADKFIISPAGRVEDTARARAAGDEIRTVIAGYHWFTDWGRDTMISLEGLTLATGRHEEARWIIRTFAHYVRHGLIPNFFPDGENEGLYHTADATLWFFHAVQRYVAETGDHATLVLILPRLVDIVERHLRGTKFGIGVDPEDGLLRQGEEGYQLTWMDAKVDGWVVTPRRGKAVEINALWYNALRLLESWLRDFGDMKRARDLAQHAERARASFNRRFWNPQAGFLWDVLDGPEGNDPACRPNQILSISLHHPVLDEQRWAAVLGVVEKALLTPVGLRSLSRDHKDYKPQYFGDLRTRDAAYHQGTVWGWLIGPFTDAWLKVHPNDPGAARNFLDGLVSHLSEACVGSISEVFDAESPFTARGCIAQAWSVAEVLRCWLKTETAADSTRQHRRREPVEQLANV